MLWYKVQSEAWAALANGTVEAVYIVETSARAFLSDRRGYRVVHSAGGWTQGTSYGCHPESGDVVAALNAGLGAFKATAEFAALCARHPTIACDRTGRTYANVKTALNPEVMCRGAPRPSGPDTCR